MKVAHLGRSGAVLAIGALALTACGSDDPTGTLPAGGAGGGGTLTGIGASSQQAAVTAWQNGFRSGHGATVQYSPDGSGAGRSAFLAGGADFAGSDAYLGEQENEDAVARCGPDGALNLPVYVSPIAVAFHLPGIESLELDAPTVARLFTGGIGTWNAPEIARQNPGVRLPDTAVTVVHRNDDSGTTENFTDYLHAAAPEDWPQRASQAWPGEYAAENAKGTSGVVATATATEGAVTYADASAVGDLGTVALRVGGDHVGPSPEAAARAVEASSPVAGRGEHDMAVEVDRRTTEPGAYPLVLVSYHIVCSRYDSRDTARLVRDFESYVVSEAGQEAAADAAGSAPLSEALRRKARAAVDSVAPGS